MPKTMNSEVISAAIEGFEAQKRRIDEQIEELRSTLSGAPTETAPALTKTGRPRRKMSASARKRIAAAQRKRWAEAKAKSAGEAPAAKAPKAKQRHLSAAGRKRIIEANRKRWAALKAAKKSGPKRGPRKKEAPAAATE